MISKLLSVYDIKTPEIVSTSSTMSGARSNPIDVEEDPVHYFKCQMCSFQTDSPSKLDSHIVAKHNQKATEAQCPMCNFKNTSEAEVNKHIEDKHPETNFSCSMCNYKNISKTEATKHMQEKHTHNSPYQCPMCSYKNKSEANITKHVKEKHPDNQYLDRHKCRDCEYEFNGLTELKSHIQNVHISCDKCEKRFDTEKELEIHVLDDHVSKEKVKNTLLIGDSHSKYQNPRLIEKAMGGKGLFAPGVTQPRTGRAYCSTRNWPNSRYPENNLSDKIAEQLKLREHSYLIFGAPGNNISNIEDIQNKSELYQLAVKSSENCVVIAEKALQQFPNLEKVIITERLPRADHLSDLSEYSNFALKTLAEQSRLSNRIQVIPMESLFYNTHDRMVSIFGSPNVSKYDGIHLYGKQGSHLYNECLISAVRSAGISNKQNQIQVQEEPISTSNMFEGLN